MNELHIIGGGLAGSEAAWQAAETGCAVVLHEMRPVRGTEAHITDGLAELVCSNSFRSDDWQNNAVGLLHEEMRRAGSLIMRAADAHRFPAGGALAVDRVPFSQTITRTLESHRNISIARREDRRPAVRRLALDHHRDRSPHLACAGGSDPRVDRRGLAVLLRRHRADREPRQHRFRCLLDAVALRQGRRCRLCQLSAQRGRVQRLHRRSARWREDRFQGMGEVDALFRGLPADRGHGGARARDASLRAYEAGRTVRSAQGVAAPCRCAASAGQCARHLVEHGRLPDQAEAWRTDPHLPHDPRACKARHSRGWAACTATPSSIRRAFWTTSFA